MLQHHAGKRGKRHKKLSFSCLVTILVFFEEHDDHQEHSSKQWRDLGQNVSQVVFYSLSSCSIFGGEHNNNKMIWESDVFGGSSKFFVKMAVTVEAKSGRFPFLTDIGIKKRSHNNSAFPGIAVIA